MSLISKAIRTTYLLTQAVEQKIVPVKILDRKINDLAKTNITTTMNKEKFLSFEEFKQKKFDSLDDYIKRKKVEYPNVSNEELAERHHDICSSMYRTYKRIYENPHNNPALMLQSDFFEDEIDKPS
ncbi:MAG: hypothetical protein JSS09_00550 [Verrucomicrobia bacterium]|nr:hypothetical protein [Verrucomicrobiota bacterium]